jgi:DNA-binding YbaB/EbfC family protein
MKSGFGDMMKQAQQLQEKVQQLQEEIARTEVVGEAGAGMIKVVMDGRYDVKQVTIDPELMQEEKEMLEDLLAAAVNNAVRKIEKNQKDKMASLTAGIPIPPGFKLPF